MKCDKSVRCLQKEVRALNPQLEVSLKAIRGEIHQVKEKKDAVIDIVSKKCNKYLIGALVTGALYVTIFVFRKKSKTVVQVCQGLLIAKEVWDSVSA